MSGAPPDPLAPDGIDPDLVPRRTLASGAAIPAIGLGTFGSDAVPGEAVAEAVVEAAAVGYRHFDCASVYGNEHLIGPALREILRARRAPRGAVGHLEALERQARRRRRHPLLRAERCTTCSSTTWTSTWSTGRSRTSTRRAATCSSRSPDARPYVHESYMKTWRQMERLVERGLVRHIGTSNMTIPKLRAAAARRGDPARLQRDGTAPALPAARAVRATCTDTRHRARSATARSARPAAPSATARPRTRWTSRTR